jgi:hypothetical protein
MNVRGLSRISFIGIVTFFITHLKLFKGVIILKIKLFIFALMLILSGHAIAAPVVGQENIIASTDTPSSSLNTPIASTDKPSSSLNTSIEPKKDETLPTIFILPFTDETGIKGTDYISKSINDQYTKKYPLQNFTILPTEDHTNQVAPNMEPSTEEDIIKAATSAGADYVIKTDLEKIEIKRGVKGLFLKKWCAAIIPVKITIWNVKSNKIVFDALIKERGDRENVLGFYMGALFTASEKTAIERGLAKIGKRMDKELPALQ